MLLSTKVIISSIILTGSIVAISAIYLRNTPKTLRDLLIKEKIKLLNTENSESDDNWKALATKHKEEGKGINFKLLKNKCKENIK